MTVEFTISAYQELLASFRRIGYQIHNFTTVDPTKSHLVLRHDIDMSPRKALQIAKVEQALDCQATYFVMLRSGLYNAWDPEYS